MTDPRVRALESAAYANATDAERVAWLEDAVRTMGAEAEALAFGRDVEMPVRQALDARAVAEANRLLIRERFVGLREAVREALRAPTRVQARAILQAWLDGDTE